MLFSIKYIKIGHLGSRHAVLTAFSNTKLERSHPLSFTIVRVFFLLATAWPSFQVFRKACECRGQDLHKYVNSKFCSPAKLNEANRSLFYIKTIPWSEIKMLWVQFTSPRTSSSWHCNDPDSKGCISSGNARKRLPCEKFSILLYLSVEHKSFGSINFRWVRLLGVSPVFLRLNSAIIFCRFFRTLLRKACIAIQTYIISLVWFHFWKDVRNMREIAFQRIDNVFRRLTSICDPLHYLRNGTVSIWTDSMAVKAFI